MGGAGASGALAEPATGGGAGEIGDGAAAGVAGADEATAGSSAMAGASVTAGDGGATGGADSGGLGGSGTGGGEVATGPRAPGFSCGGAWCDIGRRCVLCTDHNRCVPDAERDPGGYAEEMTGCELSLPSWVECDGHEDCPSGEFCVSNRNGLICTAAADLPAVQSCCPICLVITSCIRCWSDTDCPEGSLCNQPITDPYGCGLPE